MSGTFPYLGSSGPGVHSPEYGSERLGIAKYPEITLRV
jgi:hypothetical protein